MNNTIVSPPSTFFRSIGISLFNTFKKYNIHSTQRNTYFLYIKFIFCLIHYKIDMEFSLN